MAQVASLPSGVFALGLDRLSNCIQVRKFLHGVTLLAGRIRFLVFLVVELIRTLQKKKTLSILTHTVRFPPIFATDLGSLIVEVSLAGSSTVDTS
jgi:hypothetical protein